jgi:peptide/nickel transport system substrate-binding protein
LLSLTNVGLDPNDQMNVWLSSADNHQWNPNQKAPETPWEAEVDKLMQSQAASQDRAKRKTYFDKVQQVIYEQAPMIFLLNPSALAAVSNNLKNVTPAQLHPNFYWNAERLDLGPGLVSQK